MHTKNYYYDIHKCWEDYISECREITTIEGRRTFVKEMHQRDPNGYAYATGMLIQKMITLLDIVDELQKQKEKLLKEIEEA